MTTRLTLISHASTQAQRRAAFPRNEPLDEKEIAAISALKWQVPRAQQFLAAPELRAQQTAQALGLTITTSAQLSDCNYGRWAGCDFDEVHSYDPEGIIEWLSNPLATPHSGESIANLAARVGHWLDGLPETGHTIAITHPTVIRAVIIHAIDAPIHAFWRIDIAPLSVTDLRFNGKVWTLRATGCSLTKAHEEKC